MIAQGTHTQVLIVGAGPSGLMMASQLIRNGIQPIIIDSKKGITTYSKALAVQARSLEIYRQAEIVDHAVNNGQTVKGLSVNQKNKHLGLLALQNIGEGQTLFPYVLFYKQSDNEQLLLNNLTQNCCPVYWNTTIKDLQQNEKQVTVTITNNETQITLTSDWVIGADGASSEIRKLLKIPFVGETYANLFYLADIETNNSQLKQDEMTGFLGNGGFTAFFPFTQKNHFRIVGNLPELGIKEEDLNIDNLLPVITAITGLNLNIQKTNWFSVYRLHQRMADNFRNQRCFLIGDAAHIHSPVGGQGMNTGLQDGYNLSWKLAGVIQGNYSATILDTYADERMPVAKKILKSTDKAFSIIISNNWFINIFKRYFLPKLLNFVWSKNHFRKEFFKQISQIGINYRNSKLNLHLSLGTKVKAGDRLPYLTLYDEKRQIDTDLHEWCSKPGFTLLILGKFDEMFLFNTARWITLKYNNLLNFYYLPPTGKNLAVFEAFEVNPHMQKAIIVRPDMYIGYINDVVDLKIMDNYLRNVIGIVA